MALATSDPTVKMLAVGMAMAVLIDASVIRMVLVPSVMSLLGARAGWLPHWLDRITPNIDIEGIEYLAKLAAAQAAASRTAAQPAPVTEPAEAEQPVPVRAGADGDGPAAVAAAVEAERAAAVDGRQPAAAEDGADGSEPGAVARRHPPT